MLMMSHHFADWLARCDVGLALTTYQRGRLMFIGRKPDGRIRAHERIVEQCQGLWTDGTSLWVSGLWSLIRFQNALAPQQLTESGADRLFAPRETRITGRIDCHDINTETGRVLFVNTAWNCIATISDTASFRPVWRPPFISRLIGEDRCHLNGMALKDGSLFVATAVSRSDVADGWRDRRQSGGVVIDIASGELAATGLSMPHSPRWYRGRLWLLNSGTGEFGTIDLANGTFCPVAFCPGYARGLSFAGPYAIIGLSRPRHNATFDGLALDARLRDRDTEARAGLLVVDLESGTTVEWLRFEHTIEELYDVAVLPDVKQAEAIGFRGDGIENHVLPEVLE